MAPEVLLRKLTYLRQLLADLARRLQDAASMRTKISHFYEQLDYRNLQDSIHSAFHDFEELLAHIELTLDIYDST